MHLDRAGALAGCVYNIAKMVLYIEKAGYWIADYSICSRGPFNKIGYYRSPQWTSQTRQAR